MHQCFPKMWVSEQFVIFKAFMVFSVSTFPVTFTNFGQVTLVIFLILDKPKNFVTVSLQIFVKLRLQFSLTRNKSCFSLYGKKKECCFLIC